MPKVLSSAAVAALYAQQTGQAFLTLLEVNHDDLAAPIRVVNNIQDVTSGGHLFLASAFDINLPDDTTDSPPTITLTICNVDRSITLALESIASPPTVTLWVVASSTPNTYEIGPIEFTLLATSYDVLTIECTLGYEPVLNEPFPGFTFSPEDFPGLF